MRERELPELVIGCYRIVPIVTDDAPVCLPSRYVILSPSGDKLRYEYTLSQARQWALCRLREEDERSRHPTHRFGQEHEQSSLK